MTRTPDIRIRVAEAAVSELTEQLAAKTRQLVDLELAHKDEISEERRLRVEADMALSDRRALDELHGTVPTQCVCYCGARSDMYLALGKIQEGYRPSCGQPTCHGSSHRERTAR